MTKPLEYQGFKTSEDCLGLAEIEYTRQESNL